MFHSGTREQNINKHTQAENWILGNQVLLSQQGNIIQIYMYIYSKAIFTLTFDYRKKMFYKFYPINTIRD
jgi:hypothetical protein